MNYTIIVRNATGVCDVTETTDKAHARVVFFQRIGEFQDEAHSVTLTEGNSCIAVMECSEAQSDFRRDQTQPVCALLRRQAE